MRIINIIDSASKINYGIWNAAINTAPKLLQNHNTLSELWFPEQKHSIEAKGFKVIQFSRKEKTKAIIKKQKLNPKTDVIVTHGCWQIPTILGARFKKLGFKWVYVPHGMLEPWSLQQKAIKKKFYFELIEGRLARKCDMIRSVGMDEHKNLEIKFRKHPFLYCVPNGIPKIDFDLSVKQKVKKKKVLYIGRLHHKKGPFQLVKAWIQSSLNNHAAYELLIAGPDEGELDKIQKIINTSETRNIKYIGAVYGKKKEKLLAECSFFALPSKSEGFPTSILEGMNYGLVPFISYGCNFSQLLDERIAINSGTNVDDITNALNKLELVRQQDLSSKSKSCRHLVNKYYTYDSIAEMQNNLFSKLLIESYN